jgi:outer membrane protein assembly factor BamB
VDGALFVQTRGRLFKLDIATGKIKKTVTGDGSASESPKLTERGILAVFNGLTLYDRDLKLLAKGPLYASVLDFGIVKDRAYGYWYDKLTIFDAATLKPLHVVTNNGGWKFDTLQRFENDDVWILTFAEAGASKAYEVRHYGPVQSQTVNTANLPKNTSLFVEGQRLDPKKPLVRVGQRVIDVLVPNYNFVSVPVTVTAAAPVTLAMPALPQPTLAEDSLVQALPKGMSFASVLARPETEHKNGYIDTVYRGTEVATNEGKSVNVASVSTGRVKWTKTEDELLRDLGVTRSKPNEFIEKHVARWLPRSNLIIVATSDHFPDAIAAFDGATGALRWRFNTSAFTGWADGLTQDDMTVEEHLGAFWYWEEGRFFGHSLGDGHLMWELIAPGPNPSISTPLFLADRAVFFSNDSLYAMSLRDGAVLWKTAATHETRINRGPKPDQILVTEATRIRLMDINGKVLATNSAVRGSPQQVRPVIASDFIFVCGHKLNWAYALDATTLKQRWSYKADPIESSCVTAVADDEALASEKSKNYILERKTGKLKKLLTTKLNAKEHVIIDGNAICFTTHDRHGCFGQP